jgi:hypothetical protein
MKLKAQSTGNQERAGYSGRKAAPPFCAFCVLCGSLDLNSVPVGLIIMQNSMRLNRRNPPKQYQIHIALPFW